MKISKKDIKQFPGNRTVLACAHPIRITCLALLGLSASLQAQVHYHDNGQPWTQRAASGPDAEVPGWFYNLGITGLRAQLVVDEPKSLVVKYVFPKSPASGLVEIEDRIIGAGGQLFKNEHRNGYVWYKDEISGGPDGWADMGRTGAAGIANFLSPYSDPAYRARAVLHSKVIGEHPQSFPDTHGSPVMGMAYTALTAHIDPANFRKLMDAKRWWFTLAQCTDSGDHWQGGSACPMTLAI